MRSHARALDERDDLAREVGLDVLAVLGVAHLEGALAGQQRLEQPGVGDRRARHAGHLAEGDHGTGGALVEETALADDVALRRQALLEQAHRGAARARRGLQRGDVDPHRLGHELDRRRRGQVRGLDLDRPGLRRAEGDHGHARLAGGRHRQVDVDHAQLVAVAIEAHGRRLALDPRLHDDPHAPRLAREREVAVAHPLGGERQQRPRRRGGGARRGHEQDDEGQTAPDVPGEGGAARHVHGAEMYLCRQSDRKIGRWALSRRAPARASTARAP